MNKVRLLVSTAALLAAGLPAGIAAAQTAATATTDLNVRAGPGPEHPVTGVIAVNESATINGCIEGSKWCQVTFAGGEGWAYSDYLAADVSGAPMVVTDARTQIGVPAVVYEGSGAGAGGVGGGIAGAAAGAVGGALIGGPVGAAIGGVAGGAGGSITGATAGYIADPPEAALTYVRSNQIEPVYLEGEVVVGATVPEPVVFTPIPDYDYQYVYLNGQPVLVDPMSRQVVYIVR